VPNGPISRYWEVVCGAALSAGRPFQIASTMEVRIKAAGFVNVIVRKEMWPLGPWPKDERMKEIGRLGRSGLRNGFYAFSSALLRRVLGWDEEQVQKLCQEAVQELYHGGGQFYVTAWIPPLPQLLPAFQ